MSITARGGYQIVDFKGKDITDFAVYDRELFAIVKESFLKKPIIAYNGNIVEDGGKLPIIPVTSLVAYEPAAGGKPEGYRVFCSVPDGGNDVHIYNENEGE